MQAGFRPKRTLPEKKTDVYRGRVFCTLPAHVYRVVCWKIGAACRVTGKLYHIAPAGIFSAK
jgi:hypothetical protein